MTRHELHTLVDIVMDAREKGIGLDLFIMPKDLINVFTDDIDLWSTNYPTFSDFTQAVKEYIKTLEG